MRLAEEEGYELLELREHAGEGFALLYELWRADR